jgi:hypothetical protein
VTGHVTPSDDQPLAPASAAMTRHRSPPSPDDTYLRSTTPISSTASASTDVDSGLDRDVEIAFVMQSNENIRVGSLVRPLVRPGCPPHEMRLIVGRMERRGRHASVFVGSCPGCHGRKIMLVIKNELIDWSLWDIVTWYFRYPFLPNIILSNEHV